MKKPSKNTRAESDLPTGILLNVRTYGLNVLAGTLNTPAPNTQIKYSTAVVKILGSSKPAGWEFWVYVYPDGTCLKPAFLRENSRRVEMAIHENQLASMMAVLIGSNAAHAVYSVDEKGVVYSDVHGEFTKPPKPAPPPATSSKTSRNSRTKAS